MTDLPKTFDPAAIEQRWYDHWEREGLFRPDRPDATPWTIVMPPPNVTAVLHMGHGLTYNNVTDVAAIPNVCELNIGHSIVSRAVLVGMEQAVREMKRLVSRLAE